MKKRFMSLFVSFLMVCSLVIYLPAVEITASADNTASSIISIASAEIGNGYSKYIGNTYYAWCAEFVSWCAKQAGVTSIYSSAACITQYNKSSGTKHWVVNDCSYKPVAGDLIFFDWNSTGSKTANFDHVGIVVSYDASTNKITTIEGNTGGSSKYTNKVCQKSRSYDSTVKCFLTPNYKNTPVILPGTVESGWNVPVTITASKKINTYDVYGNVESSHYIAKGDSCYISAVYTNGYVKVQYPTGSTKRWSYAKRSDFSLTKIDTATTAGTISNLGNSFTAEIVNSNSGKLITNISGDAKLYSRANNKVAAQRWNFTRNSDGSYSIASNIDGKVLDVYGVSDSDTANVYLYSNVSGSNQKWFIYKRSDGKYYFRPTHSQSRVMDLENGATSNNTNVQLYTYNGSNAQLFEINKCNEVVDLGDDFKALIINKPSWKPIMQNDKGNIVLTTEDKTNYDGTLWHFIRDGDTNTYQIYSYKNGYIMKVNNGDDADQTNVNTRATVSSNTNQKWYIIKSSDGTYRLRSQCSSRVLDLSSGSTEDNTNVQMYTSNDTNAQKFTIYKLDSTRDKLNYTISAAKTKAGLKETVKVTVAGTIPYVYNYKFHILDPSGKETTVDNKCNPVYSFTGTATGKYIVWAEITSPLYTQKGSKTSKCVTITVSCTHKYTSKVTTAATCSKTGVKTFTCSTCGNSYTETIAKIAHSYDSGKITTSATCTNVGVKTYTCTKCSATKTETVSATGHNSVTDKAIAATCTTDGKTEGSHCSVCGEVIKAQTTVKATGHSYDSGKITTSATCTNVGVKTYTCTKCSATKTETVSATGHNSVTDKAIAATCTTDGKTEGSHCSVCGEVIKAQTTVKATGHSYNNGKITKRSTCTEAGTKTYTCSDCDDTYDEEIAALGHDYSTEWTIDKAATCDEVGSKSRHCTRCDDMTDVTVIATNSHSYGDWTTVKEATCTEEGMEKRVCNDCGNSETRAIGILAHTEVFDDAIAATCTADGKTEGSHCKVCNTVITAQKTVSATGEHIYGEWNVTKTASCTDMGTQNRTCLVCKKIETESIAKTSHTYNSTVVKPSATAKGYTLHRCSVCGYSYKDTYTAKLTSISKASVGSVLNKAYTGKAIKPTPSVMLSGKTLKKDTDYTLSYKNNIKTGKATITITGKGAYTGTITKTFNIVPAKTTLSSVTSPKTNTIKITWKKDSQATGYEIVYATNSKFTSGKKTVTVIKNSTTSKTISSLTKGKTYYVKVRAYKTIDGNKVYGLYSTVKKVKCK